MPWSWPSTDTEPTGSSVEAEGNAPDRQGAPPIEIEVIDLDPVRLSRITRPTSAASGKGWLTWVAIAMMIGVGLALLPGQAVEPSTTTAGSQALPKPELATTSTTLGAVSLGAMSHDTFTLLPASGLEGFVQFAGPVEFDGRYWIAGNHGYPSTEVTILSSVNGTLWKTAATVPAEDGGWLRIDDLSSFGGVLMAVGSEGSVAGPAFAHPTPGSLVIWKSADGRRWSSLAIAEDEGMEFFGLQLVPGSDEVLISGYKSPGFDTSVLAQVPTELIPGLERGDLDWWEDSSSIRVVAPPGIELFQMPPAQSMPVTSPVLFRSENLIIWETLPITPSVLNITAIPGGGFLLNAHDGDVLYSTDGRSWEETDRFPRLWYQRWGDRLVGLDNSLVISNHPTLKLFVFEDDESATIELPTEIADLYEVITSGASGLATVLETSDDTFADPITQVDGYTLVMVMETGLLRIEDPSGETSYANTDGSRHGSYVPETDSIRFDVDPGKSFEFPLAVLQDLRPRFPPGRYDVFLSADGLAWAEGQTGLRADYVDILGSAGQTFLVGLHNYDPNYGALPVTVYRTGPLS